MNRIDNMPLEKDWKLFRKKLPEWQEKFISRLNKEYMEILSQGGKNQAKIFWELDDRIKHDKKLTGVIAYNLSRSHMDMLLYDLLKEKVITLNDLSDFSEGLQEQFKKFAEMDMWQ